MNLSRSYVSHRKYKRKYCSCTDFQWPSLDFGWTLADVVRRARELRERKASKETGEQGPKLTEIIDEIEEKINVEELSASVEAEAETNNDDGNGADDEPLMEIGTWSNDMAGDVGTFSPEFESNFAASCGLVSN